MSAPFDWAVQLKQAQFLRSEKILLETTELTGQLRAKKDIFVIVQVSELHCEKLSDFPPIMH